MAETAPQENFTLHPSPFTLPAERLFPDLKRLAGALELTGAQIKLSVLAATFMARREHSELAVPHLVRGIERELQKEGRTIAGHDRERLLSSPFPLKREGRGEGER
jgi:hypothetical protein